ncbi:hypothetical protein ACIBF6_10770 [Streptosporangium amethystogenes]|uniref:hypothetical protein n=1 Tax=Streptosporangium amethystogenes TaxID=2002 RepID=UPI00378C056D
MAIEVLGPVIGPLEQDRRAPAELISQCAQEETDPERQLTAWEMPETLGLPT